MHRSGLLSLLCHDVHGDMEVLSVRAAKPWGYRACRRCCPRRTSGEQEW